MGMGGGARDDTHLGCCADRGLRDTAVTSRGYLYVVSGPSPKTVPMRAVCS